MPEYGEPTAREVLIALDGHIAACSFMQKVNLGFMGAVLGVLVVFAGYTYVHDQDMAQQLAIARDRDTVMMANLPARTAQAITGNTNGN